MAGTCCWDYMKCGREQNCPAYPQNGANCWTVEGTLCRNQRQGNYDSKIGACRTECTLYNGVMLGTIKVI